ncbi:unnamed protein product [Brassica oleracea]|uniref:Auxin-responsive protein n=1 Tax=Brassica napus TaxID=3708 RepID=A0A816V1U3_BRANA|nr:unnamed protein product [Brassica napus]
MNGGGLRPNQAQRIRTYTKVQKRGSVGRSIDVTRYSGYEELRNDLARKFGIEGHLEDPQPSDWKLEYTDHENDILLVGDDPWEEFVNCVQNIKILSSVEVQQMSLDGDLAANPTTNFFVLVCTANNKLRRRRRYRSQKHTLHALSRIYINRPIPLSNSNRN